MTKEFSYKDFFIKYGLLMAIVTVLVGILVYFSIISNSFWSKNLGNSLQNVLNDNSEKNEWVVNENISVNNPFAYNSSCYRVTNVLEKKDYTAIIIRINSFYGPLSAVFILDEEKNVSFVGYASLDGRIKEKINKANDNRIRYWKNIIPQILQNIEG